MRILHLNDRLSYRGGADYYLHALIAAQTQAHTPILAVGRRDSDTTSTCPIHLCEALASRIASPIDFAPLFDSVRPDVIHVHNVMNPVALEQLADHGAMITVQDHRFFCPGKGKWTLQNEVCRNAMDESICEQCFTDDTYFNTTIALTKARLAAVKRMPVTTLSSYMKQELVAVGVAASQIHVIAPFVHDLPIPAEPFERDRILFVGRLVAAKGVFDAVEAWKRSQLALPLVFVGTGSERARLEAMGAKVLGWLDRAQLAEQLCRAAAVLVPSRWQEPFGLVGIEALACGTPVVGWSSGGVSEWLPSATGIAWGDTEALAHALRTAIGTPVSSTWASSKANTLSALESLYKSVIKGRCEH